MPDATNLHVRRLLAALISGDRPATRQVLAECRDELSEATDFVQSVLWPVLCELQQQYRHDELSRLEYQYASRMLAQIIHQIQMEHKPEALKHLSVLLTSGEDFGEELAGQLACDLLEQAGYEVFYAGGGIANDELVAELANRQIDKLVVFGAVASTVPQTRLLIDRLHDIGACTQLQIIVGGGVFNRATGLAEEIGADLWAGDPLELVTLMTRCPSQRMSPDQRTVGKRRRNAA